MLKYYLEFILSARDIAPEALKDSLIGAGEGLEVLRVLEEGNGQEEDYRIHMHTDEPTIIFDTCAQFGKIKSVRISEAKT